MFFGVLERVEEIKIERSLIFEPTKCRNTDFLAFIVLSLEMTVPLKHFSARANVDHYQQFTLSGFHVERANKGCLAIARH